MPTLNHAFRVTDPVSEAGGYFFRVIGVHERRHGPYASKEEALQATHQLFQRWSRRARALGGHALRLTHRRWVVSLPPGTPCAGVPFRSTPTSVHGPRSG